MRPPPSSPCAPPPHILPIIVDNTRPARAQNTHSRLEGHQFLPKHPNTMIFITCALGCLSDSLCPSCIQTAPRLCTSISSLSCCTRLDRGSIIPPHAIKLTSAFLKPVFHVSVPRRYASFTVTVPVERIRYTRLRFVSRYPARLRLLQSARHPA